MELFKGENKKTMDKNKIEIQRLTANLETIRQSRFQYKNMVFQYDMDVEYFTTLLQEISTKKVLLLSIIMEMTDSWADDYNDDVKRLYSEVKKSYKETVDFYSELHKMATDKLNEAKIIQSNKNTLSQNSIEEPQNDNPKSNGIIQKDENKITDDEESVIDINLRDFLQEKKINENDYETLVKALLQYVKQGVFPYINEKIVIKTSMKKFGWAVNSILKDCDLKINSRVLKFAQNFISLFENNKEVFDETNFRNTYIYKLFTENPYKKKNN